MDRAKRQEQIVGIVRNYIEDTYCSHSGELPEFDVYIVWFCKTLENQKAIVSCTWPDHRLFEVTFNGNKKEVYIDEYKKLNNFTLVLAV